MAIDQNRLKNAFKQAFDTAKTSSQALSDEEDVRDALAASLSAAIVTELTAITVTLPAGAYSVGSSPSVVPAPAPIAFNGTIS